MSEDKGRLKQIIDNRLKQVQDLRELGVEPYPYEYNRTHEASQALKLASKLENEKEGSEDISLAGRLVSYRTHGKLNFADLQDMTGKIQLYIQLENLTEEQVKVFKKLGAGDIIGVKGSPYKTKTGQESVLVKEITVLSKAIRPLPEKWHGLEDPELKYRMRYVDLISDPKVKDVFIKRSEIIRGMREYLHEKGFIEVETPILQPIYGGAAAKPFETFHHDLGMNLFMRIAPELYLKRLTVGGFEKVFEINRCFRNEGIDLTHNPEFTSIELYQAYVDYNEMMRLVEDLIERAALQATGNTTVEYQGEKISLKAPFKKITMVDAIKDVAGIDAENSREEDLIKILKENKLEVPKDTSWGFLVMELFEGLVEDKLVQPTFILDYPLETSPLTKKKRGDARLVERFELFINGREYSNAYSELTDPVDQRNRFEAQTKLKELGDEEAHELDEDFIRALEFGLPPTGGMAIGIDRLVMLLTDSASIRDVIFFPHMRPEKGRLKNAEVKK